MKRWGTITLMLFAFVVGFTMTYNCGGGTSAEAAGDADTLQGHPAADFALVDHQHDAGDITSGVLDPSLIPAHTHSEYALSNHSHSEYMDAVTCSNNQVLKWNGSAWVCAEDIDTANTDADTLDGKDSSDFAESSHTHHVIKYLSFEGFGQLRPSPNNDQYDISFAVPADVIIGTDLIIDAVIRVGGIDRPAAGATIYMDSYQYSVGGYHNPSPAKINPYQLNIPFTSGSDVLQASWNVSLTGDEFIEFYVGRDTISGYDNSYDANLSLLLIRISYSSTTG